MKKYALIIALILVVTIMMTLVSCSTEQSYVKIASAVVDGMTEYTQATVLIEDKPLPLYLVAVNNSYRWSPTVTNRDSVGVGYVRLKGNCQVAVQLDYLPNNNTVVRPLSANIDITINENTRQFTFTLPGSGYYSIEPNGDATKAILLFVSEYDQDHLLSASGYDHIIRFGKGIHDESSPYISDGVVRLQSNTMVVVEEGAVVRAVFSAYKAKNIAICGGGIIDGSQFERNAVTHQAKIPVVMEYCEDIIISGVSFFDPAGWCLNMYFCDFVAINNVKIITSRPNGDGVSLQSCSNVTVDNCFVRSYDDSLVVKNYPRWSDRVDGSTSNILFSNCYIWTDLAQCMEIGYETVGEVMDNIVFDNITVFHAMHKPVISIHNANNANINNVTFANITVEDASMGQGDAGSNNQLIDIRNVFSQNWSQQHKITTLGSVNNVTVSNILVVGGSAENSVYIGGTKEKRTGFAKTNHYVNKVTLNNISVYGQLLTNDDVTTNSLTTDINTISGGQVTGAIVKATHTGFTSVAIITVEI